MKKVVSELLLLLSVFFVTSTLVGGCSKGKWGELGWTEASFRVLRGMAGWVVGWVAVSVGSLLLIEISFSISSLHLSLRRCSS